MIELNPLEHGALLPEPHHHPTPIPNATKGKKQQVISETMVSPMKIVDTEGVYPPAKRLQIDSKSSISVCRFNAENENNSDIEIISSSIVHSERPKPAKHVTSTKSHTSILKSIKKKSKTTSITNLHHSKESTPNNSKSVTLVHNTRPASAVLTGCPLTSGEMICTRCKLKDDATGLEFLCHCGHKGTKLYGGRAQNAEVHLQSSM